ncbi:hypothetical protein Tco_1142280 [Tanacetum coccineum]
MSRGESVAYRSNQRRSLGRLIGQREQDTEDLVLQACAARATSTNTVNTASTPVSTASPSGRTAAIQDSESLDSCIFTLWEEGNWDKIDPKFPKKVYKVVKALYGLHQAPRTCQDKYVTEILKKFDFASVKTASTPIETQKPLTKDEEAADVDVHLYRSMIGSLMYLTASMPDIMFAVCTCSRFQVTPNTSHLNDVKRIFRYLNGKPKLGLWYPKVSSFDLEAYSDSDYAGANLDKKSTTGGCQFLGRRLISWQCKKQTIVATSTTEAEYVAAANCYGQVLWIQNQMLDYGFNFMNTKIYIDNESTICIVKNPVFHSKTKHIEIRHHFIRDAYEKKLIQVLKIHTDDNVADLLTKAFDVSSLWATYGVELVSAAILVNTARPTLSTARLDSLPNQAIFDAIQLIGYEGDLTVDPAQTTP